MEVILSFIIVAVVVMAAAACASAVINIMCEEEREIPTVYGEVTDDAEQ